MVNAKMTQIINEYKCYEDKKEKKMTIKPFYKDFHCHEQVQSNEDIPRNA